MFIQSSTVVSGIMLNRAISLPSWIKRLAWQPKLEYQISTSWPKKKKKTCYGYSFVSFWSPFILQRQLERSSLNSWAIDIACLQCLLLVSFKKLQSRGSMCSKVKAEPKMFSFWKLLPLFLWVLLCHIPNSSKGDMVSGQALLKLQLPDYHTEGSFLIPSVNVSHSTVLIDIEI